MRIGAVLAVGLLVLSGCAAPDDEDLATDESADRLPAAPGTFALVCPPGGADHEGVCSYRIASLTESNQEPFIALHPDDPAIMAIGVNAGHTTDGLSDHGERPGYDMVRLDIFITTDGGETWTKSQLPYVPDPDVTFEPVENSVVGDPAMQFDEEGALHVSGIASHSRARGYNVFYTRSDDFGASWSPPVVLSDQDDNDRNWLNIGPDGTIYVPWQRVGSLSEVAWSTDRGDSWTVQERGQVADDCITISEMAFFAGAALFACSHRSGGDSEYSVHVYALDAVDGSLALWAELDMDCYWPKLAVARDALFLTAEGCPGDDYTVSYDGRNWTKPAGLPELLGQAGSVMWLTDDPWGNLHFLLGTANPRYVVLDLDAEAVLADYGLPGDGGLPTVPPETIAPAYGDHYWGVDVTTAGGGVVWTRGNSLDLVFVKPEQGASASEQNNSRPSQKDGGKQNASQGTGVLPVVSLD